MTYVIVGLFPQKQNDGDRQRPVGLEFTFHADDILVKPVNLAGVEGMSERLSLPARMAHLLKANPLTYAEIAEKLNAKLDTVIKAANRRPERLRRSCPFRTTSPKSPWQNGNVKANNDLAINGHVLGHQRTRPRTDTPLLRRGVLSGRPVSCPFVR